MSGYTIIWELKIRHGYYANERNPGFLVKPTHSTEQLMKRRGIIFKQRDVGCWTLIGPDSTIFAEDDVLEMNVYANDPHFPYVTELPGNCRLVKVNGTEGYPLDPSGMESQEPKVDPGVIMKIAFSPASKPERDQAPLYTNEIAFKSVEQYLEYIILFRDRQDNRTLVLEDLSGKETFLSAEKFELEGMPGTRIQSTRKITISQDLRIQLRLAEKIGTHVRVISRELPLPTPGVFMNTSSDMLRHIMYV